MDAPPPSDPAERFRADTEALTGGLGPEDRLGLAVSGGPDSLALLLLAHAAFGERVTAATVDHGLRAASAAEAEAVAAICAGMGVAHRTLAASPAALEGSSVQAQARTARYRLLGEWAREAGARWLATGHHMDDQAETVLMRLARGAGLAGLASVRARRPLDRTEPEGVALIRPLLGWRRAELAGLVEAAGIEPADDPTNRSDAYDRTRFRRLLGEADPLPVPRLAAAAAHLADAEDALDWAAAREWDARSRREGAAALLDLDGLPDELARRLVARAVDLLRAEQGLADSWRQDKLAAAIRRVRAGERATIAGVMIDGGPVWRFSPAPPRRRR